MTGELDPKLRIRAPLRCDGIGSLDCAEDVDSGMRMAIRWLPLEANGDAAAKAMQQLPSHPTLPKIRSTGRVGAAAYVAMEFPDGKLLSTRLDELLPASEVCSMGSQIADALATIHAQKVFHGELSADSLLLLPAEKAVLWDMPLVVANRLTDRRGEERAMASTVRMAPFLSPERAQGLPPSASGDVYALGSVMCLAAGGRPPSGATTLAIIYQIATGRWSPEVPEHYPLAVRELLKRMVARDALARPSAREVAEALAVPLPVAPTIPELPAVMPPPLPARAMTPAVPVSAVASTPAPMPAANIPVLMPVATPAPVQPEAVPAPVAPPPVPQAVCAPEPSVVLAPSMAAELTTDPGLGPELEAAALQRSLRLPIAAGLALIAVLAITAGYFALRTPAAPELAPPVKAQPAPAAARRSPVQVQTAPASAPAPTPAAVAQDDDNLLAPLSARPVKAARRPTAKKVASSEPAPAPAAEATPAIPSPEDFSFLPTGVEKPSGELKRPAF
ncbi:MAG: serine/threonine protein kinase [Myxococcaceae bacterium]